MGQHMLTPPDYGFVDPRRSANLTSVSDEQTHINAGRTLFTTNAIGTTTTAVGADGTLGTSANIVRIGDKFRLFTSANVIKEETVFRVTGLASAAGSTTVTFTPAAAVATASGDILKQVNSDPYEDFDSMDRRLVASGVYTQAMCDNMTMNDKVYALRVLDNPDSF